MLQAHGLNSFLKTSQHVEMENIKPFLTSQANEFKLTCDHKPGAQWQLRALMRAF
jgi:hypothetical protein